MPIKQVVCSICGQTVNKAQTYFTGKGRACKTHEGVTEKRNQLHTADLNRQNNARRALEDKYRNFMDRQERIEDPLKPRCFLCNVTGLRQQEFFWRALIAMQKLEILNGGPVNPFTLKQPLMTEPAIFLVLKEKCPPELLQKLNRDARTAVDIVGVLGLCGRCGNRYNVELLPKVEWEQLQTAGLLFDIIEPTVKKAAGQELAQDN